MKPRVAFPALALCAVATAITLNSCSLTPSSSPLRLNLRLPPDTRPLARNGLRSGPALSAMKCYGLIVRGDVTSISSSQIGDRVPACMKMDGAFFGPFTYEQLLAGTNLTLTAGDFSIQLVGFDGVADCGSGLSTLFGATAPDAYDVAVSESFSFPTTSTITLDGTTYNPTTAESLTPSCPPQTLGCDGHTVCDTFDDLENESLYSHLLNTGQTWTVLNNLVHAVISSGSARISPSIENGLTFSTLATDSGFASVDVTGAFNMGFRLGDTILAVTGRYDALANSYVRGYVAQSSFGVCTGGIVEHILGFDYDLVSGQFTCADSLESNGDIVLRLRVHDNKARLDIGTNGTTSFSTAAGAVSSMTGSYVGVAAAGSGGLILHQTVSLFKAKRSLSPIP